MDFFVHIDQEKKILHWNERSFSFKDLRPYFFYLKKLIDSSKFKRVFFFTDDIFFNAVGLLFFSSRVEELWLLNEDLLSNGSININFNKLEDLVFKNTSDLYKNFFSVLVDDDNLELDLLFNKNKLKTNWIIYTSGTTSIPKKIVHKEESLLGAIKPSNSLGNSLCWGLTYDIKKFAGIQVFFQAIIGGGSLILPSTLSNVSLTIKELILFKCNALSATPTFWRSFLMLKSSCDLDFILVTLGGEIVDQPILDQLKFRFPNSKITHIYASTELGVCFSVSDGMAGFPLSIIGIRSKNSKFIIKDDMLYRKKKQSISGEISVDLGFVKTGDLVEIKEERVYFLGRESGAINVGGLKVMPERVEAIIRNYPNVSKVKVFGKANHFSGSIVCALVSLTRLSGNVSEIEHKKNINTICKEKLEKYERPAIITFVDDGEIKINSSGKLKRL